MGGLVYTKVVHSYVYETNNENLKFTEHTLMAYCFRWRVLWFFVVGARRPSG